MADTQWGPGTQWMWDQVHDTQGNPTHATEWNSITDNPIGHFFLGDPQQGYQTAAQGAQQANQGYSDLANWQWNTAMQGMGRANQAYDPSNAVWNQLYGRGIPSSQTQGVMNQFQTYMGQPSFTQSQYLNNMGMLGTNQTADYNNQFGGQMTGRPSSAESFYNPANYGSPGAMESFYGRAQSMLGDPGRTETMVYDPTRNMGNFAAGLAGQQGTGATTQGAGEIGSYYRDANDVSRYAGSQMGQLQGPGTYEDFVSSEINGTNPAIQRETDQGLARINQEMARRGAFRSGAADTAIGNFLGEEQAKETDARAQRAQAAQGMQLSRIGAGQSLSQASAQNKLSQGQALQSLAGQTDQELMARLGQQLQAQQGASQEGLANSAQRLNYAQAGDQGAMARAGMLGNFANQAQNAELARLMGGQQAAGMSDQGFMNRMMAGYGMAQGSDQSSLARAMGLYNMAQGTDQGQMGRYGMLAGLAGGVDQNTLAQMGAMMGSRMGLDQAVAGNIGNFYGMGMQGYGTEMGNALNALANYYQLLGTGQSAENAMPLNVINTGIQGYKAYQTGGKG